MASEATNQPSPRQACGARRHCKRHDADRQQGKARPVAPRRCVACQPPARACADEHAHRRQQRAFGDGEPDDRCRGRAVDGDAQEGVADGPGGQKLVPAAGRATAQPQHDQACEQELHQRVGPGIECGAAHDVTRQQQIERPQQRVAETERQERAAHGDAGGGSGPEAEQQVIHAVQLDVEVLELRVKVFPLRQATLGAERGVDLGHGLAAVDLRHDARRQRR